MNDSYSRGISYSAGFFMLIAFTVAGVIMASFINGAIWVQMTGKSVNDLTSGNFQSSDAGAHQLMQVVYQIIGFLLPTIFTARLLHLRPFDLLGYSTTPKRSQTGTTILILSFAFIVSVTLGYISHSIPIPADWKVRFDQMEEEYQNKVTAIIFLSNSWEYILALIVMGLVPAICEETLFRGGLQNFLARASRRPWFSIIVVSLIFSAFHTSFYGFLSRFFLGIVLGLLFHYSGKLWVSILGHFVNNAIVVTILYVQNSQGITTREAMEGDISVWWGLLALPLVVGLVIYFKKISIVPPSKELNSTET